MPPDVKTMICTSSGTYSKTVRSFYSESKEDHLILLESFHYSHRARMETLKL
jgi:hypothetical protein